MSKVLVVDDERGVRFTVREILEHEGFEVVEAESGEAALQAMDGVAAVLTDYAMRPGMDGIALLSAMQAREPLLPVLLMTAHGDEKIAVAAMKAGARDYITKPFDADELVVLVRRAVEWREGQLHTRHLEAERTLGKRVVFAAPTMQRLYDAVQRVAGRDVTVLVRGETGTGKELIGELLHAQSRRKDRPLVRFNCAAIPGDLAEAELFGHVKGAFTGATGARRGFFAEADGGTLVLDEIGELPLGIQAKLLRALQEGEIQPVGSGRVERVDVRIVALTNRNLQAEARAGRFREDLYYRLAVVELMVPPLRERRDDVSALAGEFVRRYGEKFGVPDVTLAPEVVAAFGAASWPGNVRELENTIARLVALSPGGVIDGEALRDSGWQGGVPAASVGEGSSDESGSLEEGPSLKEQVEAFERGLVARALAASSGNQSEAARRLRTSRVTLIDKMKKYGLGAATP